MRVLFLMLLMAGWVMGVEYVKVSYRVPGVQGMPLREVKLRVNEERRVLSEVEGEYAQWLSFRYEERQGKKVLLVRWEAKRRGLLYNRVSEQVSVEVPASKQFTLQLFDKKIKQRVARRLVVTAKRVDALGNAVK